MHSRLPRCSERTITGDDGTGAAVALDHFGLSATSAYPHLTLAYLSLPYLLLHFSLTLSLI